jgi:hypothetical protein
MPMELIQRCRAPAAGLNISLCRDQPALNQCLFSVGITAAQHGNCVFAVTI